MEIKEIQNEKEWDDFVTAQERTSILQSWHWRGVASLGKQEGKELFIIERGTTIAACRINKINLPLGFYYLYSPRGPIFRTGLEKNKKEEAIAALVQFSAKLYPQAIFLRIDPALEGKDIALYTIGFRKANKETQPRHTLILDIRADEENILEHMKPKTRYNIRLAQKKGVKVIVAHSLDDVREFYEMLKHTESRNNFHLHPLSHYQALWKALSPDNLKIYLAETNGEFIAGIMVANYGNTSVYLHGGTSYEHRSYMAPYLLHWQAIIEAKKNGSLFYDLWGVAPRDHDGTSADHPWSGITRFKEGFGGEYREYVGSYDYVYRSLPYKIFNVARSVRRKLR